jgi:predicted nucleotidyltransferase
MFMVFLLSNILSTVKGLDNHRTEFLSIGNRVHKIAIRQNKNAAGQDINANSCNASRIIHSNWIDARSAQKKSTATDRKAHREDW